MSDDSRRRLLVVVLNYCTPELTIESARSIAPQLDPARDRLVVVDNASDDDSRSRLEHALAQPELSDRSQLLCADANDGFSAGNNLGMLCQAADFYLLVNSDCRLETGLVDRLLAAAREHPEAGLIGPRIVDEQGQPQTSGFRYPTPLGEWVASADIGLIARALQRHDVPLPPAEVPEEVAWLSFACVLVRGELLRQVGPMDEGYFLYFEDVDYCRRARESGWRVRVHPEAQAIHSEGGSSGAGEARRGRTPMPPYYYAARSRYFAKYYGQGGLWLANTLRTLGYPLAWLRAALGRRGVAHARGEALALWHGALRPLREPRARGGGRSAA